jgi:Sec-independent protein translocase protein TatA
VTITELVQIISDGGSLGLLVIIMLMLRKDLQSFASEMLKELKDFREDLSRAQADRLKSEQETTAKLLELVKEKSKDA